MIRHNFLKNRYFVGMLTMLVLQGVHAAQEMKTYILAEKKSGDMATIVQETSQKLEAAGFEIAGSYASNSLALLSDAGHMLTDALAIGLAIFAVTMACRPASPRVTYGYYRLEILAALANGILLGFIAIWLFYKAYLRFTEPPEVADRAIREIILGDYRIVYRFKGELVEILTIFHGARLLDPSTLR